MALADLRDDPLFPFTGDIAVKPLAPAVVPEPPRVGEEPGDCPVCVRPDEDYIWTDARWRLAALRPTPIKGIVLLEPRAHVDSYADMPPELLTELGPMVARIERALLALGDVARVHTCRWGDGGAHFHLWLIPRPLGALQLRGSILPIWLDLLPPLPDEVVGAALDGVRRAVSAGTGRQP